MSEKHRNHKSGADLAYSEDSAISDPVYHISIPKNEEFVERKTSMEALQDKLFRSDAEQITIYESISSGKTQLALWLAYWVKDNMQDYSVFWAAAMSKYAFEHDCHQIVKRLGYRCTAGDDPKIVLQRYLRSYSSGKWILILDGASDEDLTYGQYDHPFEISEFLPNSRKGLILVTTGSKEVALVGDAVVTLSFMTPDESFSLLSRSLVSTSHDQAMVKELLEIIPHQPVGISLAAAYININEVAISSYIGFLKDAERSAMTLLNDISDTRLNIYSTFYMSFEQIEKHFSLAARVLLFVSFFEQSIIRTSILPGAENVQQFEGAMKILYEYGFLATKHDGDILHIHRHIHRATRIWTQKRGFGDRHRGAVAAHLVRILTTNILGTRLWRELSLTPIMVFLAFQKHFNRDVCDLGCLVGQHLRQIGRVEEAIEILEAVLKSQNSALGKGEACYLALEFELASCRTIGTSNCS